MYQNSSAIGDIGETIALAEFAKLGFTVLVPFGGNCPYDLVVDIGGRLLKIQCKTTEKVKDGKMIFSICRTNGFTYKKEVYTKDEVDFLFLYCIENGYMALVPIEDTCMKTEFRIRTERPKNNQVQNIHMETDYRFHDIVNRIINQC